MTKKIQPHLFFEFHETICRLKETMAFSLMIGHPPALCWKTDAFSNKKILKYAKTLKQGILLALRFVLRKSA
jgi:hypothetical protein